MVDPLLLTIDFNYMITSQYASIVILAAMLTVALYTDLRWCRIYNKLTLPCILIGLVLNTLYLGYHGLLLSIGGIGLIFLLYITLAPAAGIGGGDIKLMMAVGSLMGVKFLISALLLTAIIGGIMSLIVMARHRILGSTTKRMASNLYMRLILRAPVGTTIGTSGVKFRYSLAIALGTALAFFMQILP
jgi:prepilin peptidase CpaA